jgi:hypothetical protein
MPRALTRDVLHGGCDCCFTDRSDAVGGLHFNRDSRIVIVAPVPARAVLEEDSV